MDYFVNDKIFEKKEPNSWPVLVLLTNLGESAGSGQLQHNNLVALEKNKKNR